MDGNRSQNSTTAAGWVQSHFAAAVPSHSYFGWEEVVMLLVAGWLIAVKQAARVAEGQSLFVVEERYLPVVGDWNRLVDVVAGRSVAATWLVTQLAVGLVVEVAGTHLIRSSSSNSTVAHCSMRTCQRVTAHMTGQFVAPDYRMD